MADWFETRFREPVDAGTPDPAFVARVRALVVEEWQADAGSTPSEDIDPQEREEDIIMLETQDRPAGNAPGSPSRRPPGRWLLVAAAVAVIAVIGAALVAFAGDDDDSTEVDTATSTPSDTDDVRDITEFEEELEPGTYFIDPDGDETTPLRVTFDVATAGWGSYLGPGKATGDNVVALSITTVDNVVRDGCSNHSLVDPPIGPTVDDLATALSTLAPFELSSPVSDVSRFGYQGKHLQLTVPDLAVEEGPGGGREFRDCGGGNLYSWVSPTEGLFNAYNGQPGMIEDLWILDVEGTRLLIDTLRSPDAAAQDIAEMEAIVDSIDIEP